MENATKTMRNSTVVYPPQHNKWSRHMFLLAFNSLVGKGGSILYDGTHIVEPRRRRAK